MALSARAAVVCLSVPSHDTVQTLHGMAGEYDREVAAACNLQKDSLGGLSGVWYSVPEDAPLSALVGVTTNLFAGVSVVACDDEFDDWDGRLDEEVVAFAAEASREREQHVAHPRTLERLVPLHGGNDFFFANQRAAAKEPGTELPDPDVFGDAFRLEEGGGDPLADRCVVDAGVWHARLSGEVAVLHAPSGSFLVCRSGVPDLATELVESVRRDLPPDTTCETFATSKEVWFLEGLARRNRLRILAQFARALGVAVATTPDALAHPDTPEDERTLAVERYGIAHEMLLHDEARARVVHAKGCVRLTPGLEHVPIWLGGTQGMLLWEQPCRTIPRGDVLLLPTTNLARTAAHAPNSASHHAVSHADVWALEQYGQLRLTAQERRILLHEGERGGCRAVAFPGALPVVLAPHHPAEFVAPEKRDSDGDVAACLASGLRFYELDDRTAVPCVSDPAPATTLLHWDPSTIETLAFFLDAPQHAARLHHFRPRLQAIV